jgi:dsRNA-specific ribonuclease
MEIVLNEATFSLPCRTFTFNYSITDKRQLPVVKEFVVRLLYTLERCELDLIASYFGFSQDEINYVISDLLDEKLVFWEDENDHLLTLTQYAKDRFENVDGCAIPRFFKVIEQSELVSFDLHSFKLISNDIKATGGEYRGNLELILPKESYSGVHDKASSAFDEQFMVFLEKVKNINTFRNATQLYKINNVSTKYDRFIPIKIKYLIDSSDPHNSIMKYADSTIDEWDDERKLFSDIDAVVSEYVQPTKTTTDIFTEYLRNTDDPLLGEFWVNDKIELPLLLEKQKIDKGIIDSETCRLIGNLYTNENNNLINRLIENKEGRRGTISSPGAIWSITPQEKLWGRGQEISSMVKSLEERFSNGSSNKGLVLLVPSSSPQEAFSMSNVFSPITKNIQGVHNPWCNSQTEVLLIPNVLVACLIHFNAGDNGITIPLGFVSTNDSLISDISKNIHDWSMMDNNINDHFEKRDNKAENSIFESVLLPILVSIKKEKIKVDTSPAQETQETPSINALSKEPNEEHGSLKNSRYFEKLTGQNISSDLWDVAMHHFSSRDSNKHKLDLLSNAGKRALGFISHHIIQSQKGEVAQSNQVSLIKSTLTTLIVKKLDDLGLSDLIKVGPGIRDAEISGIKETIAYQLIGVSWSLGNIEWIYTLAQEAKISLDSQASQNNKTALQEFAQSKKIPVPSYSIKDVSGPNHAQVFNVECSFNRKSTLGSGVSKKDASEDAAKLMMEKCFVKNEGKASQSLMFLLKPKDIAKWTRGKPVNIDLNMVKAFGIPDNVKSFPAFISARAWNNYSATKGGNKALAQLGIKLQEAIISRCLVNKCMMENSWSKSSNFNSIQSKLVGEDFYSPISSKFNWDEKLLNNMTSEGETIDNYKMSVIRSLYALSYLSIFEERFCNPNLDQLMKFDQFNLIYSSIYNLDFESHKSKDPKTELQELAQDLKISLPVYEQSNVEGLKHELTLTVKCTYNGLTTFGKGSNMSNASLLAASIMLSKLQK